MNRFNGDERRLIIGMGLLTGIRTLGASMIMPVFSYYALQMSGATAQTIGIAIGIFGISQTLFQVPFGNLSDRLGRKNTTIFGSLIYTLGIILCGLSNDIYSLTASRFLAGAGAVSGVTMAWITGGVNERRRNTAVAYLGICIGLAVIAGFPLSWVIAGTWGASSVFYACAVIAVIAVGYTIFFVNDTVPARTGTYSYSNIGKVLKEVMSSPDMRRLIFSGFIANACCACVFFVMPLLIINETQIDQVWKIFAPAAVIGTALMFYFAKKADTLGTVRIAMIGFAFELAGVTLPMISNSGYVLIASLTAFYSGHCILSPILPSAVSRYPENELKGTVMSVFTSFQFLGAGIGGIAGGFILSFSSAHLFGSIIALILIAFVLMAGYRNFTDERDIVTNSITQRFLDAVRF
jgi:MFS family permease